MRNIYILLINSNTLLSRLIRSTTKAEFTHASISLSDEIFPCSSFGRKYSKLMFPSGLKKEQIHSGFLKKNKNIPCGLFKLTVSDEQHSKATEYVENMFRDKKRHGFNLMGLVMCKFGIPIKRKRRMFCSEFVASVLKECDIVDFENPSLVQPVDLTKIDGIECVHKGTIESLMRIL